MNYEAVIGLEIHAQLLTDTKIFCGCSTEFGSEPNTQTCPVCTGMPGVLPVMNRKAVEYVVRTGLALNCEISSHSRFARKNYFYPDLPKGYQISQFELPLCEGGYVEIPGNGSNRRISLTRIHLEEDAGKNIHVGTTRFREGSASDSFVDLNRAGVPLMEIVSEPDIRTAKEATDFMKKLRTIVRYINVSDGNMEQGSLRCDANVSVRPEGTKELGVKTEIKNLNSFRFIEKALEYEIKRQVKVLQEGGRIVQETRLWNTEKGITESMRSKEEAHDYRYFPDPDLLLASERSTAEWYEEAVKLGADPKAAGNWIKGDFMKLLNEEIIQIYESKIKPGDLVEMLGLIEKGTISGKIAKTVFEEMYKTGKKAGIIVEEKGLVQMSDESGIESIIDDILANNIDAVEKFKAGENKLMGFFVGQVMKETKGKANPKIVNEILRKKLG
jgi:aspartyl-tRNA(Asn)/glutamyl-tRNA(Gln) amidotransferase subunit B